ncbi:MAG TPA: hypothetical protein VMY16_07090 [Ilumatobacteraceae bacterium]|nr:hypothetical protein [Ilumatobacteraceae bacterium]
MNPTTTKRRPPLTVVLPDEAPTLPPLAVTVLRQLVVANLDQRNRAAGPDESMGVAS